MILLKIVTLTRKDVTDILLNQVPKITLFCYTHIAQNMLLPPV
jgi:hypothetical protein